MYGRIAFFCATALFSVIIIVFFLNGPGYLNGNANALFLPMVYGKAHKPYVNRALVPITIRSITTLTPTPIKNSMNKLAHDNLVMSSIFEKKKWEKDHVTEYLLVSIIIYFSTIGFVYSFRALLQEVFNAPSSFFWVVPFSALWGLPIFFNFTYIYDIPQLFLFTLGLYLITKGCWKTYLFFFFLACVNKETSLLLAVVFIIHFFDQQRMNRYMYTWLILAQLFIFSAVKIIFIFIYKSNSGGIVENHLLSHLNFLMTPYSLPDFLSWGFVILLVCIKWNLKPQFIKDALWIAVPLFILFIPFGFQNEIRIFYEVYPIFLCLIAQPLALMFGLQTISKKTLSAYHSHP